MRLFFAAMLPPETQKALSKVRAELSWLPVKGVWSSTQNLHITLKFLGEVPDAQVNDVALAVQQHLAPSGSLTFRPESLLFLPPRGDARVLGVSFSGDVEKISAIQEVIETVCENLGYIREARPFVVHCTLARFRDGLRPIHHSRIEHTCMPVIRRAHPFEIAEVQLFQSSLAQSGPEYAAVARFPL